jgi:hypothetical protein
MDPTAWSCRRRAAVHRGREAANNLPQGTTGASPDAGVAALRTHVVALLDMAEAADATPPAAGQRIVAADEAAHAVRAGAGPGGRANFDLQPTRLLPS